MSKRKKRIPKGVNPLVIKYRARLDKAWRKAVHEFGGGKCFISSETKLVNTHHIIDRRCYTSRWNLLNGVLLSPIYHKFGSKAIHNNPLFVLERWAAHISMLGWAELNELARGAKSIHELTEDEQAKIVLSALKELRPDLYEKEIKLNDKN